MSINQFADELRKFASDLLVLSNKVLQHQQETSKELSLEEIIQDRLDATEAAALLGVSKKTLYNRVNDGSIPHTRVGDNISFSKKELCKTFNIYYYD